MIFQYGNLASLSVLSIMRWPRRHGQSNAIHLGRLRDPTKTAQLRGRCSGMSSADVIAPMILHPKTGNRRHQGIFIVLAISVPEKVL